MSHFLQRHKICTIRYSTYSYSFRTQKATRGANGLLANACRCHDCLWNNFINTYNLYFVRCFKAPNLTPALKHPNNINTQQENRIQTQVFIDVLAAIFEFPVSLLADREEDCFRVCSLASAQKLHFLNKQPYLHVTCYVLYYKIYKLLGLGV